MNPINLSAALHSVASAQEVLAGLRQLPLGSSARFAQSDPTTLVVSSGSKLRYRLLGTWSGSGHLPMKLRFDLTPSVDGTSVHITLTNDESWYLFQTPLGRDAYQARFDELLAFMWTRGIVQGP